MEILSQRMVIKYLNIGGLFYGNYMLSHNINPIDGKNTPYYKQVYSSALVKTIKNNSKRKPKPPRKTPDGIRNTPIELDEIKSRNPIFQLKNSFPEREIKTPNLLNARYFKSAKNTPTKKTKKERELEDEEYDFDINEVLENKIKTKPSARKKERKSTKPKKSIFDKPKPIEKKSRKPRLDNKVQDSRKEAGEPLYDQSGAYENMRGENENQMDDDEEIAMMEECNICYNIFGKIWKR